MRRANHAVELDAAQADAADNGVKAMIPIGRPFLDYVLSAVADAGYTEVCLVIGPEHDTMRSHYSGIEIRRIRISFEEQERALGTADAVLAAEHFVGGERFLVLNADNYYPATVLAELRRFGSAALAGFDPEVLVRDGNVSPKRLAGYAVVEVDDDGMLRTIVEKPTALPSRAAGRFISMNAWLFGSSIFEACRSIAPSSRGELELSQAVQHLVDKMGARIRVIPVFAPVLDLSTRADIPTVAARLAKMPVRL